MRKFLSIALALTLCFAVAAPAFAANETSGSTDVTYTVVTNYFVSIPEDVEIVSGSGTQTVAVTQNSVIPADKSLALSITGATNYDAVEGFRLKNNVGTDVYLAYDITYPTDNEINDLVTTFLTADAATSYAGTDVMLTFTTDTAESAGTYEDQLTFTVALV